MHHVQTVGFKSPNKTPRTVTVHLVQWPIYSFDGRVENCSPPNRSHPPVPLPEGLPTPRKPFQPCSEWRWAPATAASPSPPEPQQCCARESSLHAQLLSPPGLLDPHHQEGPLLPLREELGCSSLQKKKSLCFSAIITGASKAAAWSSRYRANTARPKA